MNGFTPSSFVFIVFMLIPANCCENINVHLVELWSHFFVCLFGVSYAIVQAAQQTVIDTCDSQLSGTMILMQISAFNVAGEG